MKELLTILTFLTSVSLLWGQQFGAAQIIEQCVPCSPVDITAADLDNDGHQDLLIAGSIKGEIVWARNNGNETFSTPKILLAGDYYTRAVYPADLNNDGLLDLAIASGSGFAIGWSLNEGNGIFGEIQATEPEASDARDVEAVDLDNDGWLDLVGVSKSSDELYWYRNENGEGFSERHLISNQMNEAFGLSTGDLDGDGDIDIFCPADPSFLTSLSWFRNDGNGQFSFEAFPAPGSSVYQVTAWELGDVDNDGDLDIVTGGLLSWQIRWHRNDGQGSFSLPISIHNSVRQPTGLDLADIDADGDLDIMVTVRIGDQALYLLNNGSQVFSNPVEIIGGLNYARTVQGVELNGDHLTDIVTLSSNDDEIFALFNRGALDFAEYPIQNPSFAGLTLVETADLNGDGRQDMIVYAEGDGILAYQPFLATGIFGPPITIANISRISVFKTADINGDGALDLVIMNGDQYKLEWYPNEGADFGTPLPISSSFSTSSGQVKFADLDADGDLDIIAVDNNNQEVRYILQRADQTFGPIQVSTTWADPVETVNIKLRDINNDNRPDLFLAYQRTRTIARQYASPTGGFEEAVIIHNSESNIGNFDFYDVDQDNRLDLVLHQEGELQLHRNLGNFTFAAESTALRLPINANISHYQLLDLNSDGVKDIAAFTTADRDNPNGEVWGIYNLLNDELSDPALLTTYTITGDAGNSSEYAFLTDLDNDRDADLLFFQRRNVYLAWKENFDYIISTDELRPATNLMAYPNPFSDQLQLGGEQMHLQKIATVRLYNTLGQLVSRTTLNENYQLSIPPNLQPGLYLLKCQDQDGRHLQTLPVLKQ